jgi:DNA-directed RNA polymerase subunit RPC12/RpoP
MIGVINKNEKVKCPECGWKGLLGDAKCALFIDQRYMTPPNLGGDGYNFRCPECKTKVKEIRYAPPYLRK